MGSTRSLPARRWLVALACGLSACGGGGTATQDTGSTETSSGSSGSNGSSNPFPSPYVFSRWNSTVPAAHPRVLLTGTRKAQLLAARTSPEYVNYKRVIDDKLANPSSFSAEEVLTSATALLYQMTGDTRYCTAAIGEADQMVLSDPSLTTLSRDSYLRIAADLGEILLTFDHCYDLVSADQKARWISYANQGLDQMWASNDSHWPFDDPHNNYWYGFLEATLVVGLITEGDNPRANEFRDVFRSKVETVLKPAWTQPAWSGPGGKEGTHYDKWHRRLFRTLAWWHDATGEDLSAVTDASLGDQINYWLHQMTPGRNVLFQWGDEAANADGRLGDNGRELFLTLMSLAPTSAQAGYAKDLLANSPWAAFSSRAALPLDFILGTPQLAAVPIASKPDLYLHTPALGAGKTFIRSSWGLDASALSYSYRARSGPAGSHDHSEKPAFQWFANGEFVVVNPNYFSVSGVVGTSNNGGARAANLVRLEGIDGDSESTTPTTVLHQRDVPAAGGVPHYYYHAFDTAVAWPAASVYRRDYLHFTPNVLIVFDHITAPQRKIWQINTVAAPTFNGSTATVTTASNQLRVMDALPSPGAAGTAVRDWSSQAAYGTTFSGGYRLSYADTATDYWSVKILDIGNAVSAYACTRSDQMVNCTLTLAGQARTVSFGGPSGVTVQ